MTPGMHGAVAGAHAAAPEQPDKQQQHRKKKNGARLSHPLYTDIANACHAHAVPQRQHAPRLADSGGEIAAGAYRQRYIALEVLYLGWEYHGFASQATTDRTIEASHPLLLMSLSRPKPACASC
jgi:hypothetical protein